MQTYQEFADRLARELHAEPMPETLELFRKLSTDPEGRRRHNLPAAVTTFVGRDGEIETLRSMMHSLEHRVVTLLGTGGVGKSRLALEAARSTTSEPGAETWLVELARISASENVPAAIASALAVPEERQRPLLDSICEALGARRVLLILDNCEHVLDCAAHAAAAVLRARPAVSVIATSREVLHIDGETRFHVSPLPVPGEGSEGPPPTSYASIQLFLNRAAKNGRSALSLTDDNVTFLRQIARRLGGVPLSIELAAGRLGAMTLPELTRGLADRFRVLIGGSRDALPQHRTGACPDRLELSVPLRRRTGVSGISRVVHRWHAAGGSRRIPKRTSRSARTRRADRPARQVGGQRDWR